MRIGLLCCWSNMRIYPVYSSHLRKALEDLTGHEVPVITTNCMCFHKDDSVDTDYEFINLPYYSFDHPTHLDRSHLKPRLKHYVETEVYSLAEYLRGRAFASRANDFDVVDFEQSSYAFGYESLVSFLSTRSRAKKVVTIHKLDPIQMDEPRLNRVYNKADGVITFSKYMKETLVRSGVRSDKVSVVYHGTVLPPLKDAPRDQAIVFCGSPLPQIKGFEQLVVALRLLQDEGLRLRTKVYGFWKKGEREYAASIAEDQGVDALLDWQSFRNESELIHEYGKSVVAVIPYTGYAGYFPAAYAMGSGVPVVATDILGHSEYVEGSGLLVPAASSGELASAIKRLLDDEPLRSQLAAHGRERAEERLSWETVAKETLQVFENALAYA